MNTIKKENKVEVWGDRPYYILEVVDGKITFKMLYTNTLTSIIETLQELTNMSEDAILIACCFEQYQGSFNVEVNPDEQYKEIYNYGNRHYKTFTSKGIPNSRR